MEKDLTKGNITKTLLLFAVPMILGNLLQQFYNITDTVIVGRFIGSDALAAVGSAYTLMTFLTSVIIGLCMGCGALFSMYYGAKTHGRTQGKPVGILLADTLRDPRNLRNRICRNRRDSAPFTDACGNL